MSGGGVTESSYDIPDFGLLYDTVPAYATRRDVSFYVDESTRAGTVLELGCGTGRILLPVARAGGAIVGVDGSREMLRRCEAKLLTESESVRARVALRHADVRDLDLGTTFDLVIAPFRMLQHLTTIDDQLRCFGAVARHLAPGARFAFDVFNPNFAVMASHDGTEHEDTPEQPLPDGRSVRRGWRIARVRWVDQVNEVELAYYVAPSPGAAPERRVQSFDMRWYLRDELAHLLARSGFRVDSVYGDFDRTPLGDTSPEQVVVARRL